METLNPPKMARLDVARRQCNLRELEPDEKFRALSVTTSAEVRWVRDAALPEHHLPGAQSRKEDLKPRLSENLL